MRSIIPTVAPLLLGTTLVYALPQGRDPLMPRDTFDPLLGVSYGSVQAATAESTPSPTPNASTTPSTGAQQTSDAVQAAPSSPNHDTVTQSPTNSASISSTSGSLPNPDETITALDVNSLPTTSSTASSTRSTLAVAPTVASSHGVNGHGVLTGIVAGGLIFGFIILGIGLWLCYRRRGSRSGASTPKYTTAVVGDEKRPSPFAFLRGGSKPWKKNHVRVRSSMSFASPILENDPKMVETPSSQRAPLAPHLSGGSTSTRADWKDARWSTFSSSDSGSMYPQTPVTRHLSGIIRETVVESDATSDIRTPTMTPRHDVDYLVLQRAAKDNQPPPLTTEFDPRIATPASNRYSDDPATPTTTSSGGRTFGSAGNGSHYLRTSQPPPTLPTQFRNNSGSLRSGSTGTALVNARPKFNVTSPNGSDTVSIGQESGETIRITNPFLADDEDLSSYGHGMMEEDDLPDVDADGRSMRSMDSRGHRAYPSSNGCLDPSKMAASPSPEPPTTRPRSSLISDSSSDYPYPLGYAIDADGNVANPFLRISEILEEVDGRMRWPSPPLLPRSESRTL